MASTRAQPPPSLSLHSSCIFAQPNLYISFPQSVSVPAWPQSFLSSHHLLASALALPFVSHTLCSPRGSPLALLLILTLLLHPPQPLVPSLFSVSPSPVPTSAQAFSCEDGGSRRQKTPVNRRDASSHHPFPAQSWDGQLSPRGTPSHATCAKRFRTLFRNRIEMTEYVPPVLSGHLSRIERHQLFKREAFRATFMPAHTRAHPARTGERQLLLQLVQEGCPSCHHTTPVPETGKNAHQKPRTSLRP